MTTTELLPLILLGGGAFLLIGAAVHFTGVGSLNNIKSKTVGDGQHGTARWATKQEIQKTYRHIPFRPDLWRRGEDLPTAQGLVLGCVGGRGLKKPGKLAEKVRSLWRGKGAPRRKRPKQKPTAKPLWAIVDVDDIHCLMIGASGVGKTAFFLYPNLEYACASGMSFLALDTKGDLARNYGTIASRCYGYQVAVIDLRNPTRSDGYNLLTLINHYMDVCREDEKNLAARAKAEKYAKILAKTIVNPEGDASNYGQNAFFYDAAEGLLTAVILLLAEYLPPTDKAPQERRHIVSVFKLVQDLLAPSKTKGKTSFHILMDKLPDTHKARWFAGAALTTAEQSMNSVMSTVLSRLNAFLDTELEQVLCFDSAINAETYLAGASYQELVEALQERGIAYDEGKLWNKNMVARILEDKRYSGTDRYPAILPEEQYRGAQERRRDRAVPVRKTPAQMELRRLCGGPPPAWVEQQTLTLLNRLVQHPERIASGQTEMEDPAESRKLRRELEEALQSPPVDGERTRNMALRLAEHRLNAIGAEEYETTRLQKLFRNHPLMEELERELLCESVRQITYRGKGIQVRLKNGQIMKGGQQP